MVDHQRTAARPHARGVRRRRAASGRAWARQRSRAAPRSPGSQSARRATRLRCCCSRGMRARAPGADGRRATPDPTPRPLRTVPIAARYQNVPAGRCACITCSRITPRRELTPSTRISPGRESSELGLDCRYPGRSHRLAPIICPSQMATSVPPSKPCRYRARISNKRVSPRPEGSSHRMTGSSANASPSTAATRRCSSGRARRTSTWDGSTIASLLIAVNHLLIGCRRFCRGCRGAA